MKSKFGQTREAARASNEDGSMDTILASIRRILNEDEVAPAESAPELRDPVAKTEAARPADDVLVLGEAMIVPAEKVEPLITPQTDQAAIEGLVAARTRAAASQSFDALHEALRRDQGNAAPSAAPTSPTILRAGGPTLEDLVRSELRALLSEWLDVHLPGLVETLVKSEIEKLTRRT